MHCYWLYKVDFSTGCVNIQIHTMANNIFVIVPFAVMHVLDFMASRLHCDFASESGCGCAHYVACIFDMIGCSLNSCAWC